jgi:phosphohistidine phosphatase
LVKIVILFRHGKSDWNAPSSSDHDRPLAKRGRRAADQMGRFLAEKGEVPELAVSSTALRARDTLERAVRAGDWDCRVELLDDLYLPSPYHLLHVLEQQPEPVSSVMLVGHEPAWSGTLSLLVGGGEFRFPTAAMARVDVPVDRWKDMDFGLGELRWLVTPKEVASTQH